MEKHSGWQKMLEDNIMDKNIEVVDPRIETYVKYEVNTPGVRENFDIIYGDDIFNVINEAKKQNKKVVI